MAPWDQRNKSPSIHEEGLATELKDCHNPDRNVPIDASQSRRHPEGQQQSPYRASDITSESRTVTAAIPPFCTLWLSTQLQAEKCTGGNSPRLAKSRTPDMERRGSPRNGGTTGGGEGPTKAVACFFALSKSPAFAVGQIPMKREGVRSVFERRAASEGRSMTVVVQRRKKLVAVGKDCS